MMNRPRFFTKKQHELLCLIYPAPVGQGMLIADACELLGITRQAATSRLAKFRARFPEAWEQYETARRISQRHRMELGWGRGRIFHDFYSDGDDELKIKERF